MTFRRAGVVVVLLTMACDSSPVDTRRAAGLALSVTMASSGTARAIDQARVHIEGPTERTITATPGSTQTITGLQAGTYTVAIEGLVGGVMDSFGETGGVSVTGGQNTPVGISLQSFVPAITQAPATLAASGTAAVQFQTVSGATSYLVEWATDPGFAGAQSTETSGGSANIQLTASGRHYVRVRARNRFGLGGPSATRTIDVLTDVQLTVNGAGSGNGTVTSTPPGISCTIATGSTSNDCTETYAQGTMVTLSASAANGSAFAGWSGACTGSSCQVEMTAARTVTSTFNSTIMVSLVPNAAEIQIGQTLQFVATVTGGPTSVTFASNAPAVATVNATGVVTGVALGSATITATSTVDANAKASATITVTPVTPQFGLTVSGAGTGAGTVTSTPAGINCSISAGTPSGPCTRLFAEGTQVTLTPASAAGSTFAGWSGACAGTGACVVAMTQARDVNASFAIAPSPINLTFAGAGGGRVAFSVAPSGGTCSNPATASCTAEYASPSQQVTLTATNTATATFASWSGACTGTTPTCSLTVGTGKNVTVNFDPAQITTSSMFEFRNVYPQSFYEENIVVDVLTGAGTLSVTQGPIMHDCGFVDPGTIAFGVGASAPTAVQFNVKPYLMGFCSIQSTVVIHSSVPGVTDREVAIEVRGGPTPNDATAVALATSNIAQTTATLNGHTTGTRYSVNLDWSTDPTFAGGTGGSMFFGFGLTGPLDWHANVTGLQPNTTYYVRFVADVDGDCCAHLSNVVSFKTLN